MTKISTLACYSPGLCNILPRTFWQKSLESIRYGKAHHMIRTIFMTVNHISRNSEHFFIENYPCQEFTYIFPGFFVTIFPVIMISLKFPVMMVTRTIFDSFKYLKSFQFTETLMYQQS